jgi:hypothetical protein
MTAALGSAINPTQEPGYFDTSPYLLIPDLIAIKSRIPDEEYLPRRGPKRD